MNLTKRSRIGAETLGRKNMLKQSGMIAGTVVALAYAISYFHTQQTCLESEYPGYTVTWQLNGYCIASKGATVIHLD